ncbi:MAG TPA: DUF1416 domain-containing protein [Actinomycetota bacterium]|nr:DUF1416 domain-containing protein [Actinomycetota bacterium]
MASIDGVVFEGIDTVPYAAVRLLAPGGGVVAEQTANSAGEFRFVVPSGLWGIEANAGDQKIAVRDVMAFDGERFPVYVCLDSGERRTFRRSRRAGERATKMRPAQSRPARVVEMPGVSAGDRS